MAFGAGRYIRTVDSQQARRHHRELNSPWGVADGLQRWAALHLLRVVASLQLRVDLATPLRRQSESFLGRAGRRFNQRRVLCG